MLYLYHECRNDATVRSPRAKVLDRSRDVVEREDVVDAGGLGRALQ
jgi:hypothetical protein